MCSNLFHSKWKVITYFKYYLDWSFFLSCRKALWVCITHLVSSFKVSSAQGLFNYFKQTCVYIVAMIMAPWLWPYSQNSRYIDLHMSFCAPDVQALKLDTKVGHDLNRTLIVKRSSGQRSWSRWPVFFPYQIKDQGGLEHKKLVLLIN